MEQCTDREGEFDAFYAASAPRLVRQLHAMTGELTEAQDCVQEAYARAWQRWSTVCSYDAPEAWVRQVAWRLAVSRFRRARVGRGLLRRHRLIFVKPASPWPLYWGVVAVDDLVAVWDYFPGETTDPRGVREVAQLVRNGLCRTATC